MTRKRKGNRQHVREKKSGNGGYVLANAELRAWATVKTLINDYCAQNEPRLPSSLHPIIFSFYLHAFNLHPHLYSSPFATCVSSGCLYHRFDTPVFFLPFSTLSCSTAFRFFSFSHPQLKMPQANKSYPAADKSKTYDKVTPRKRRDRNAVELFFMRIGNDLGLAEFEPWERVIVVTVFVLLLCAAAYGAWCAVMTATKILS